LHLGSLPSERGGAVVVPIDLLKEIDRYYELGTA
jgi:hypothetical protein